MLVQTVPSCGEKVFLTNRRLKKEEMLKRLCGCTCFHNLIVSQIFIASNFFCSFCIEFELNIR